MRRHRRFISNRCFRTWVIPDNGRGAGGLNIRPEIRAAVKYDFLSDEALSTVTMPGINSYVVTGERLDRLGGEFGLGVTMTYAGVDVSLNYDIEVRDNYTSQTGMVRARYNF